MPTIKEAINEGAARLGAARVEHERRTANVLLGHALSVDRIQLLTRSDELIGDPAYQSYLGLIERRCAGEPLQYITGHQEFYGLDFMVTPAVLIPRPETELLVERIFAVAEELKEESPLIVDVGTGSGCIAVVVAVKLPRARVIATDISQAALAVAQQNAERHRVKDRIEFLVGDLFGPLAERGLEGSIDIIASNPPYVNEGRPELIQREVRDWEPREALFAGVDGLDVYRRLIGEAVNYVKPGGYLIFEIGYSQLDAIASIIAATSWELLGVTRDLQGIPRTLTMRRR